MLFRVCPDPAAHAFGVAYAGSFPFLLGQQQLDFLDPLARVHFDEFRPAIDRQRLQPLAVAAHRLAEFVGVRLTFDRVVQVAQPLLFRPILPLELLLPPQEFRPFLRTSLSPETAERLQSMSIDEQRRKIAGMMHNAFRHESAARHMRGPLPEEHEKRLAQFFEDKLTSKQQEDLLNLPGDEMMRELRRIYLMQYAPPSSPGQRNDRNVTKPRPVVAP